MTRISACAVMPHPPIMIPEIGNQELNKIESTVHAVKQAAQILCTDNPKTVIIISPHGPAFSEAVSISIHPRLRGSLEAFGAPEVSLAYETDGLIAKNIIRKSEKLGINLLQVTDEIAKKYRFKLELDHGALVPLYYLHKAGYKGQLVHLSAGNIGLEEMYTFGRAVQAAVYASGKKTVVIASGDLSHRVNTSSPYGFSASGPEFDKQVVKALADADVKSLLNLDKELIEEAGQCGLSSIVFLFGVMGGTDYKSQVLSYEGPFGIGYAVSVHIPVNNGGETDGTN